MSGAGKGACLRFHRTRYPHAVVHRARCAHGEAASIKLVEECRGNRDDNEAAADSLAQLLSHNGHETRVVYTATQALEACDEYEPSVALLDIGLPDLDGYELARRIRQKFGAEIMLVALTGYGQAEDKQKAADAGFDEHLTKPVSIVDVERVLLEIGGAV